MPCWPRHSLLMPHASSPMPQKSTPRPVAQRTRPSALIPRPLLLGRSGRRPQSAEEADEIEQLVWEEGLLEDHGGLELGIVGLELVGGDDDHRRLGAALAEPAQPLTAVHARHGDIEDDEQDI